MSTDPHPAEPRITPDDAGRQVTEWQPGRGSTLYVHVPFCVVKCGYCDFFSVADSSTTAHDVFLDGLERELSTLDLDDDPPPTVFIGGGTPSFLDPERFARLLRVLGQQVDLGSCTEVTMEANPESVTQEKAEIALEHGVRRFSVGAQSFDAKRLASLDRAHDAAATQNAVRALRDAGVENLSLDLMFSLPGQSLEEWQHDLDQALDLSPDHLSCYNLVFEPGTRFRRDLERGTMTANEPEHDLVLFDWTRETLAERGFEAYEISNFAGAGGPCLHNDHYWLQGNYRGVGPGAASHADGRRTTNLKSVQAWADRVRAGDPTHGGEVDILNPAQRLGEALWLGLRRRDGIDLAAVTNRLGFELPAMARKELDRFVDLGLLSQASTRVHLTPRGIRVADALAETFLVLPD